MQCNTETAGHIVRHGVDRVRMVAATESFLNKICVWQIWFLFVRSLFEKVS